MTGSLDVKLTVLGEAEIGRVFSAARSNLRPALLVELDKIGRDMVQAAKDRVPYGPTRKHGSHTRDKIDYGHGLDRKGGGFLPPEAGGPLRLTVLGGEPLAHIIERGVNATVTVRRNRKRDVYASDVRYARRKGVGRVAERNLKNRRTMVGMGVTFVKAYRLTLPARPYFIPAVQSIDVGVRLQDAVRRAAAESVGSWFD